MPECLGCGKSFTELELDAGKCKECRKYESDIIAQEEHDREQHTKLQADQKQDKKEQQERWDEDYQQKKLRQEEQTQKDLEEDDPPQDEPSTSSSFNDTLENAINRSNAKKASRGKIPNYPDLGL